MSERKGSMKRTIWLALATLFAGCATIEDQDELEAAAVRAGLDPRQCVLHNRGIEWLDDRFRGEAIATVKCEWLGMRGGAALGLAGRAGAWTFGVFGGVVGYRAPLCFGDGPLASYCVQTDGIAATAALARSGLGTVAADAGVDVLAGNPVWSGPLFRIGVRAGF